VLVVCCDVGLCTRFATKVSGDFQASAAPPTRQPHWPRARPCLLRAPSDTGPPPYDGVWHWPCGMGRRGWSSFWRDLALISLWNADINLHLKQAYSRGVILPDSLNPSTIFPVNLRCMYPHLSAEFTGRVTTTCRRHPMLASDHLTVAFALLRSSWLPSAGLTAAHVVPCDYGVEVR
jgi:hypothetical protein